jgi:hypothetical protein
MPLSTLQRRKLARGESIQIAGGRASKNAQIHHVRLDKRTHKSLTRAIHKGRGKRIYGTIEGGGGCGGASGIPVGPEPVEVRGGCACDSGGSLRSIRKRLGGVLTKKNLGRAAGVLGTAAYLTAAHYAAKPGARAEAEWRERNNQTVTRGGSSYRHRLARRFRSTAKEIGKAALTGVVAAAPTVVGALGAAGATALGAPELAPLAGAASSAATKGILSHYGLKGGRLTKTSRRQSYLKPPAGGPNGSLSNNWTPRNGTTIAGQGTDQISGSFLTRTSGVAPQYRSNPNWHDMPIQTGGGFTAIGKGYTPIGARGGYY